jgi:periplasmic divalent cation tolerance protein
MVFDKLEKGAKDIVFVYTTCADMDEARYIGYRAVEEKLAISADYWLINSIYPWKGVIKEIDQCMLLFVTERIRSDNLMKFIEEEHSYNIPAIIRSDSLLTNEEYSFWVENTLDSKDKYISEQEYQAKKKQEEGYQLEKLK